VLPVEAYSETVTDAFEDVLNKGGVWVISKKVYHTDWLRGEYDSQSSTNSDIVPGCGLHESSTPCSCPSAYTLYRGPGLQGNKYPQLDHTFKRWRWNSSDHIILKVYKVWAILIF